MDRIIEEALGKLKGHVVKIAEEFDRRGLSPHWERGVAWKLEESVRDMKEEWNGPN